MTTKRAQRKSNRTPVGGNRSKLSIPEAYKNQYPDFVFRFVNDVPGRIRRFQDAGYEIVEDEGLVVGEAGVENSRFPETAVVKHVGRTRDDNNTASVLMRIHKDYYEEDQAAKEEEVAHTERAMFTRNKAQEGFYEKEHKQSRS